MLKKLIKYEFKATYKFMLMLYCILFVLSLMLSIGLRFNIPEIINRFSSEFNFGGLILIVLATIFVIIFAVISAATLCGMFFYSIVRFKNNLLGNEGYLMHTLPVTESQHILSKLIVSVLWTIAGGIALMISYGAIILVISSSESVSNLFFQMPKFITTLIIQHGDKIPEITLYAVESVICGIVNLVFLYLHLYTSMAVGYSFNTHRMLISVAVYIGISIASNTLQAVAVSPFRVLGFFQPGFNFSHFLIWFSIISGLIMSAALFIVTKYFMSKKLNLQ